MTYREVLSHISVAVSVSESADMAVLGLGDGHLRDAAAEIARHLMALGGRLVYGGDLRANGFSKLLFELVARYRRDADLEDNKTGVVDFLAWPVHAGMDAPELLAAANDLAGVAELICLSLDGISEDFDTRLKLPRQEVSNAQWSKGLSAMRRTMLANSQARIVLGGRTDGYRGIMPGVAEEALLSLQAGQPVYILGGFGGCARDIASKLKIVPKSVLSSRSWNAIERFSSFGISSLQNGLTPQENAILAETPHIDQAIILVLRGLTNIKDRLATQSR